MSNKDHIKLTPHRTYKLIEALDKARKEGDWVKRVRIQDILSRARIMPIDTPHGLTWKQY